jgi:GntR family transcriptional regulator, rspAB operon transcriptional repressor
MGKESLSDMAYNRIRRDIVSCVLMPGQQVAQAQLARDYGLGLTPVREALQRLSQERLVQPMARLGYIVSPISVSDVHEIFEMRLVQEGAAARWACERATEQQLAEIAQEAEQSYVYGDRNTYAEYLAHNSRFHLLVAESAGNRRLYSVTSNLLDEASRVLQLYLNLADATELVRELHVGISDALRKRDPVLAEAEVARHQDTMRRNILALVSGLASGRSLGLSKSVQIQTM